MTKLTLAALASLSNDATAITQINNNSNAIVTALENTLSRDGTSPNSMGASLDMNSNRLINLPAPLTDTEPVRLIDAQTGTALAASFFKQPLTGAVTRTWQTKVQESVSVKDFGAIGDGVTDDTTAIQAALTATNGATCYFPSGTYCITSSLTIPVNCAVELDSNAIVKATVDITAIFITNAADEHLNNIISGGFLDCNTHADHAIWIKWFSTFRFENIEMWNNKVSALRLGLTAGTSSYEALISNCKIRRALVAYPANSKGIDFEHAGDSHVSDTIIMGQKYGIYGNCSNGKIMRVHCWNPVENGQMDTAFYNIGVGCHYIACQVDGAATQCWYVGGIQQFLTDCGTTSGSDHTDNTGTAVYVDTSCFATVTNCNLDAITSHRYATDITGPGDWISHNNQSTNVTSVGGTRLRATDGSVSQPAITFDADRDTGLYRSNTNEITIAAGGHATKIIGDGGIETTQGSTGASSLIRYSADSFGAFNYIEKSRNATLGTHTILQNNDIIGGATSAGSDGVAFIPAAQIRYEIDSAPGVNNMPGRIVFSTNAGAAAVTDRLIIDSAGHFIPAVTGGIALGTTTKMFSNLFLATGAVINFNAGNVAITHAANSLFFTGGSYQFGANTGADRTLHVELDDATTNAVGNVLRLTKTTSGTAASGLGVGIEFEVENGSGTNRVICSQSAVMTTVTNGAEASKLVWATTAAGAGANVMELSSTELYPTTDGGLDLGDASHEWGNAYLKTGKNVIIGGATQPIGGKTTISTGATTSGTVVTITGIPQTYSYLQLQLNGVSSDTATRHVQVQFSTDNGATYDTTASQYIGFMAAGAVLTAIAEASIMAVADVAAANTFSATLNFMGYQGNGLTASGRISNGTTNYNVVSFYNGGPVNAMKILWNGSGNFDAGSYTLLGFS